MKKPRNTTHKANAPPDKEAETGKPTKALAPASHVRKRHLKTSSTRESATNKASFPVRKSAAKPNPTSSDATTTRCVSARKKTKTIRRTSSENSQDLPTYSKPPQYDISNPLPADSFPTVTPREREERLETALAQRDILLAEARARNDIRLQLAILKDKNELEGLYAQKPNADYRPDIRFATVEELVRYVFGVVYTAPPAVPTNLANPPAEPPHLRESPPNGFLDNDSGGSGTPGND